MTMINGKPMIIWQIQRIRQANNVDHLIVATSSDSSDDRLVEFLEESGVAVHRGPLQDVFARYLEVVNGYPTYEVVLRLTADCPLVMPNLLSIMISEFKELRVDYYSNCNPPTYPDGLDIEIFTRAALLRLSKLHLTDDDREHVTLGFRNKEYGFSVENKFCPSDFSSMRWTVDYQEDLLFVKRVYEKFTSREMFFDLMDVVELVRQSPDLFPMLSGELRNNTKRQRK
jgi:spore coat polysaccharide biosynthesis protein SpsF (cytidylyltransferase family)